MSDEERRAQNPANAKRRATGGQLTKDKFEQEDVDEEDDMVTAQANWETGSKADTETLKKRTILKAKRRGGFAESSGASGAGGNPFAGVSLAAAPTTGANPFAQLHFPPKAVVPASEAPAAAAAAAAAPEAPQPAPDKTAVEEPAAAAAAASPTAQQPSAATATPSTSVVGPASAAPSGGLFGRATATPSTSLFGAAAVNATSGFGSVAGGFGGFGGGFGGMGGGGGFGKLGGPAGGPAPTNASAPLFSFSLGPGGGAPGGGSGAAAAGGSPKEGAGTAVFGGAAAPAPAVQLQEVPAINGEEGEKCAFSADGTLFSFDEAGKSWRERGRGELKICTSAGRARMIMRNKGALRVILNASLYPQLSATPMTGGKGVTFACANIAAGASEEEGGAAAGAGAAPAEGGDEAPPAAAVAAPQLKLYALRVKHAQLVDDFIATVDAYKLSGGA